MRIPSGKTDQVIYFVAVDSTDLKTRETGLSSFTVYRSRNGGIATVYTTPTVTELSSSNMPGVYSLLIDEDTTIASGSDSEEYCLHITQASMAPVTRVIELYRRTVTSGDTIGTSSGAVSTVTTLTNLPAISANWLTAAGTAADFTTEIQAGLATAAALTTVAGYIDTEIADIQARLPAALVGGRMDSNVSAIGNDTTALTAFKRAVLSNVIGTVGAASTTTSIVTSSLTPAAAVIDQFKGLMVKFDKDTTTANLRGQGTDITASTALGVLTVTALTDAPVSGDTFTIT